MSDHGAPRLAEFGFDDLQFSPTAFLWEGGPRAGTNTTAFIVRTPPGKGVGLHVHPYAETFIVLRGTGRWTAGDHVTELGPDRVLVVPPDTEHGFRNTGDEPLLVVSIHDAPALEQEFTGEDPA